MPRGKKGKIELGREAEILVSNMIQSKSTFKVKNLNDIRTNFPMIDLIAFNRSTFYHVSVKAKKIRNGQLYWGFSIRTNILFLRIIMITKNLSFMF